MNCYLKELNLDMGKDVYEMYQDIPAKESGSTNECFGLSFDDFPKYLEKEINRKYNKVTFDDTPTISYIMYDDNKPIGLICLRTEIDDNWMKWSGNFYYKIRLSERKKGYGIAQLELCLEFAKRIPLKQVVVACDKDNIASASTAKSCGGVLANEFEEDGVIKQHYVFNFM